VLSRGLEGRDVAASYVKKVHVLASWVWYLKNSVILYSSLRSTSTTDIFRHFIPYSSFSQVNTFFGEKNQIQLLKNFTKNSKKRSVQVVDMEKEENVVILDVETIQGEA
jgi:hypothetical protein